MKSFDDIKKELRERIKIKQTELIESDINSEEYTNILNELELLNLEYKEISSLKGNNFVKKLEEYTKLKTKYAFLENLDMKQINDILLIIRQTNKSIEEAYDNGVEFTELTNDYRQELQINDIDYTKINSSETLEKIIELLSNKYENFKIKLEEFYSILRNFSAYNYELLSSAVEHNKYLSIDTLNELRGLGSDSLIDAIINNYENKKRIKREPFILPNKREEMLEKIDKKIKEYLKSLCKSLGLFVKHNYKEYKDILGLTIDEYKEEDIIYLYSKILKQIADKNTEIKSILKTYKFLLTNYKGFEKINNKRLTDIGLDLSELENSSINIYELSKDDIFEILSKMHTYNNLQQERRIEETPKLILATEE